jgi:hypothetical protein
MESSSGQPDMAQAAAPTVALSLISAAAAAADITLDILGFLSLDQGFYEVAQAKTSGADMQTPHGAVRSAMILSGTKDSDST